MNEDESSDRQASAPPAPRRFFIILNPAAGRGVAARVGRRLKAALDRAGAEFDLTTTRAPGHAVELAERASLEGWPAVVAVGGDGTVHEVANGLLRAAEPDPTIPLGIVPAGSGNDFFKLVGATRDPERAARAMLDARPRTVDAGRVGDRYFINGVGIGFDARVAVEARRVRRLRGTAIYAWALLNVLRSHRTPRMRVSLDGVEMADRPLTLVTVGNGGCHGGGFWICPEARIDDGLLDVCVADALTRAGILAFVPRAMRGTHVGRPGIAIHRGRTLHITSSDPVPVHVDGEILHEATREVACEVLPGRLTVLG